MRSADLELPLAKPRDTVETPSGRFGIVMAVLPDNRREVQYLDKDCGNVILKASLLRVVVDAAPRPWSRRIP